LTHPLLMPFAVARPTRCLAALTIFGLLITRSAAGPDAEELVRLINAYRGAPQTCEGRRSEPLAPLSPQPALFDARVLSAGRLMEALKAAGHPARHASVIVVSGTADPGAALIELKRHYCAALLSAEASEVGASREDLTWRIALVQPLLGADLPDWRQAGRELLELVNAARAQTRRCGDRRFAAAPALKWNERLAQTALAHSSDMAQRNYFDHRSPEGSQAGERALRSGYRWRSIGENIAAGQGKARDAVAGWLVSPGHCANIMSPAFSDTGAAYAIGPGSEMTIYWTQVFGAPQP
jgi:uncharacterized protein YkwD